MLKEEREFKSIRGSGETKQIELFVGRDGTKCEKFNVVGLFIKDNGNGGGLSKFPALKIGLKEAKLSQMKGREKDRKGDSFERGNK